MATEPAAARVEETAGLSVNSPAFRLASGACRQMALGTWWSFFEDQ